MFRRLFLLLTHAGALAIGFALGIYALPILTAPPSPDAAMLEAEAEAALFTTNFTRDLRGSDFLHWGEGKVSVATDRIVHEGALAPGPDYKLYLTKGFVEHEDEFNPIKSEAQLIGDIKSSQGFVVDVPSDVDINAYTTVVIWCESFGEFITAAAYQ